MKQLDQIKKGIEAKPKDGKILKFFLNNDFWNNHQDIELKHSWVPRYKIDSKWSLEFLEHDLTKVFGICNPRFKELFKEAASAFEKDRIYRLHSSSLAALLLFQHVTKEHPIHIKLNNEWICFTECCFEQKNQISLDKNNKSNVDLMLLDEENKTILFLESKFSEYLEPNPTSFSWTDYYENFYNSIKTLLEKQVGIKCTIPSLRCDNNEKVKKKIRLETMGDPIYCEGVKQMISHFMGVKTMCEKGFFKGKQVYLGEILFDFRNLEKDIVPGSNEKLTSYKKVYCSLKDILQNIAGKAFKMTDFMTWQDILHNDMNHRYLKSLEPAIKSFYRL